ncbi:MAG: transglutaminase family protein [Bacteroidetes bacterium]|nr:transglutaminase family protein [Bacteroidota bacterium]
MIADEVEKNKEIKALISLIDDPDETVYTEVFDKLIKEGQNAIPLLEKAWENSLQPEIQNRIETITHQIQFESVCNDLEMWLNTEMDVLSGSLIVARYQYPNLTENEIRYEINKLRKDIWIELNDNLTALEQIKVFNHIFYEVFGFKGDNTNYHSPQNSYINIVLNSRKGNPLSLGIIYMILSQSLELPIYGVNLPEHFVLAYTAKSLDPDTLTINDKNVLFYINAFSGGAVLSYKEIEDFLRKLDLEPIPPYFNPCSNLDIIKRMINNLILSYEKNGEKSKVKELKVLKSIIEPKKP